MSRTKHHSPNYKKQANGNFDMAYHLEMVSDSERVKQLKKGIDKVVNEHTIFCELGCGTGIFSIYAAQKAKRVYSVEADDYVFGVASSNIRKSGFSDKIILLHDDALKVTLPEKVDVVFCEMLSIWMIEEPQILVMNHAKNFLKSNGITIPQKVINLVELCNTDYVFEGIEVKASIAQFTGIKNPRVITESKVFNKFHFFEDNPLQVSAHISFEALVSGVINSARLSSIVEIVEGINFYSTDTLMPLTIVPLEKELKVKEGEMIRFFTKYNHRTSLSKACFKAELQ